MPELNGLEAAERIRTVSPHTELLMLTIDSSNQLIRAISAVGVRGYVLKSDCDLELVRAVKALESHQPYFTNYAVEIMLKGKRQNHRSADENLHEPLTIREMDTLKLIAQGKTSVEIGGALGISTKTADTHRANLMRKLELHSIPELVRYALRNHVVDP